MIMGVAVGKGVCIGNGVDVGKGVVVGGAVGVKVGVGTGVEVAVGAGSGVGVGTGLTDRPQPNRNPTRRKTAILKFRTIAKHLCEMRFKLQALKLNFGLTTRHLHNILGMGWRGICQYRSASSGLTISVLSRVARVPSRCAADFSEGSHSSSTT
jgi:hypothetical protein